MTATDAIQAVRRRASDRATDERIAALEARLDRALARALAERDDLAEEVHRLRLRVAQLEDGAP